MPSVGADVPVRAVVLAQLRADLHRGDAGGVRRLLLRQEHRGTAAGGLAVVERAFVVGDDGVGLRGRQRRAESDRRPLLLARPLPRSAAVGAARRHRRRPFRARLALARRRRRRPRPHKRRRLLPRRQVRQRVDHRRQRYAHRRRRLGRSDGGQADVGSVDRERLASYAVDGWMDGRGQYVRVCSREGRVCTVGVISSSD